MTLSKLSRAGDGKVFAILEGPDRSLRAYIGAQEAEALDFEHVYRVEVTEAE